MVSSLIARHSTFNDKSRLSVVYPASVCSLLAAGPDEMCKCIVLIERTAWHGFDTPQVFDTPVYLCCHRFADCLRNLGFTSC